jgi:hypothetical protein
MDFLRWAEGYHAELAEFYESCGDKATRPELKRLMNYMARHQDALRRIIEEYERGGSKALLETWYKVSPAMNGLRDPDTSGFHPDMAIGEAIDKALDLDHGLMAMYEELIRRAESESLREMLMNLLDIERREEIQLMRTQSACLTGVAAGDARVGPTGPTRRTAMTSRTGDKNILQREVEVLEQMRDELRLQAHLLRADMKKELDTVEKRFDRLRRDVSTNRLRRAASDSVEEISEATRLLLDTIRDGLTRVRKSLKSP